MIEDRHWNLHLVNLNCLIRKLPAFLVLWVFPVWLKVFSEEVLFQSLLNLLSFFFHSEHSIYCPLLLLILFIIINIINIMLSFTKITPLGFWGFGVQFCRAQLFQGIGPNCQKCCATLADGLVLWQSWQAASGPWRTASFWCDDNSMRQVMHTAQQAQVEAVIRTLATTSVLTSPTATLAISSPISMAVSPSET